MYEEKKGTPRLRLHFHPGDEPNTFSAEDQGLAVRVERDPADAEIWTIALYDRAKPGDGRVASATLGATAPDLAQMYGLQAIRNAITPEQNRYAWYVQRLMAAEAIFTEPDGSAKPLPEGALGRLE